MNILHVIPAVAKRYGGPSTAIFPMCRALKDAGCEAQICTTTADGGQTLPVKTNEWIDYQGVKTIFFPAKAGEFKYSQGLARWLDEQVGYFDLVHIHAVFNHSSIAAARACRKCQVPYIVRPLGSLDPWSMQQKPLKKRLFWRIFGKWMLECAAAVHYTSKGEKGSVETTLNLNHGVVVPLGVSLLANQFTIRDSQFAMPYILFLSRLHPKKGLEGLIEAFSSLVSEEQFRHWTLLIAGDGDEKYLRLLQRRVRQLGAMTSVKFLGWLNEKEKLSALSGASLFTLPSYHENFGNSVVEAMACGVPVLISANVDLASEVDEARAGWITAASSSDMAAALKLALTSQEERERRGQAAKAFAGNYCWPAIARDLLGVYRSVAG